MSKELDRITNLNDMLADKDNILTELVDGLTEHWARNQAEIWNRRGPGVDVESGLRKLLSSGYLSATEILKKTSLGPKVELAMTGIRLFQSLSGLSLDGVLGGITWKRMRDFRGCNELSGRGEPLDNDSVAKQHHDLFGDVDVVMFCCIDARVSSVFDPMLNSPHGAIGAIADAWDLWLEQIDVSVKFINSARDSNILIRADRIDTRAGVILADATIGGPGKLQQLTLRIDEEEVFDRSKFVAVIAHEIGHLLGLRHVSSPGHLMSPSYNPAILKPLQTDIRRCQSLWGVRNR